jgi:glycosyltransferase involved in cell wall biosynthesis
MRYAVITPVRNEAANLPRLAPSVLSQTLAPTRWIIVDDSSEDGTLDIAQALAAEHPWITVVPRSGGEALARGGPVVRSFHAGLEALEEDVEIVIKLDADVTLATDYVERLVNEFQADPQLGIASGRCFDEAAGGELHPTGDHVWGMARAYRTACLSDVLPLEERMGWDGVDEFKAHVHGWHTGIVRDAHLCHHRTEGHRDGSRWRAWEAQGDVAWFMCYRPLYLLARTTYQASREPAAFAMVVGYVRAALRKTPRLSDAEVIRKIRDEQRLRQLPKRLFEVIGRA